MLGCFNLVLGQIWSNSQNLLWDSGGIKEEIRLLPPSVISKKILNLTEILFILYGTSSSLYTIKKVYFLLMYFFFKIWHLVLLYNVQAAVLSNALETEGFHSDGLIQFYSLFFPVMFFCSPAVPLSIFCANVTYLFCRFYIILLIGI